MAQLAPSIPVAEQRRIPPPTERLGRGPLSLLFLIAFSLLVVPAALPQDCSDPINGCSSSENRDTEDEESRSGESTNVCSACAEISAALDAASELYYGPEGGPAGPALTQAEDGDLVQSDHALAAELTGEEGARAQLAAAEQRVDDTALTHDQVVAVTAELAREVAAEGRSRHSARAGDPNILATGTLAHSEVDMSFSYEGLTAKAERTYRSGRRQWSSFGPGWSFRYDSRIIFGTNPGLVGVSAEADRTAREIRKVSSDVEDSVRALCDRLARDLDVVSPRLRAAERAEAAAQSAYDAALAGASGSAGQALLTETLGLLEDARATAVAYHTMKQDLTRDSAAVQSLREGGGAIDGLQDAAGRAEALASRVQHELEQSRANESRNRYASHPDDPPRLARCGLGAVTLIDFEGVAHLYRVEERADSDGEARYSDGSQNFYPTGARLVPEDPQDDPIALAPDGSLSLLQRNGGRVEYDFSGLLEAEHDANGNSLSCLRDRDHVLTAVEDDAGRRIGIEHDGERVVALTDPMGRSVQFDYDERERLSSVVDLDGDRRNYHYTQGLLTAIEKPDGSSISYRYGSRNGRPVLTATIDEEGYSEQFEYADSCTVHRDAGGVSTAHYFDERLLETRVEHADGTARSMSYDQRGYLASVTDELGNITRYRRDERGNPLVITYPDAAVEEKSYDQRNRLVSATDARGNTTSYRYDERGNLLETVFPDASRICRTYDSRGNLISRTDETGDTLRLRYDRYGYLSELTDAAGNKTLFTHDSVGNLLEASDAAGNTRHFSYTPGHRLARVTDPDGNTHVFRYDSRKDLVESIDPLGNTTRFVFDRRHQLVRSVAPSGVARSYRYNGNRKVEEFSVDDGSHWTYDYDARGLLASVEGPVDRMQWSFRYDAVGRLIAIIDSNGKETEFRRDSKGRVVAEKNPLGLVARREYDPAGNLSAVVDAGGGRTEYSHDSRNRVTGTRNALGGRIRFEYDRTGAVASIVDERGSTWRFAYDRSGHLSERIDPLGHTERYTYSPTGRLTSRTDAAGSSWHYRYDSLRRLIQEIDPLGGERRFCYDAAGRLLSATDPNGNTTTWTYDPAGRPVSRTAPSGAVTRFRYHYLGELDEVTDPAGGRWGFGYDAAGRVVSKTDPLGGVRRFRYDGMGNVVSVTDPAGNETTYELDALGRCIEERRPDGFLVRLEYDPLGNVASETDPLGRSCRWEYDELSRVTREITPSGAAWNFRYDESGNLVSREDPDGRLETYGYDELGRLTREEHGGDGATTFGYNATGRLANATGPACSYRLGYDALGRVVSADGGGVGGAVEYRYDANGNCTKIAFVDTGDEVRFRYGRNDQLLEATDPFGGTTRFRYDERGNRTSTLFANGSREQRRFDAAGRVISLLLHSPLGELQCARLYVYDKCGRRSFEFDPFSGLTRYRYDALGRLTAVSYPHETSLRDTLLARQASFDDGSLHKRSPSKSIPEMMDLSPEKAASIRALIGDTLPASKAFFDPLAPVSTLRFSYDPNGNRILEHGPLGTISFAYGPDHELLRAGGRILSYDKSGNLASSSLGGSTIAYHYSAGGRLARVSLDGVPAPAGATPGESQPRALEVGYAYDPFGRRISRSVRWAETQQPPATDGSEPSPLLSRRLPRERRTVSLFSYDRFGFAPLRTMSLTLPAESRNLGISTPRVDERSAGPKRYRYLAPTHAIGPSAASDATTEQVAYANGRPFVSWKNGKPSYLTCDPTGSVIAVTDWRGRTATPRVYAPFGFSLSPVTSDPPTRSFAGKTLDPVTGFVDFGLRDYDPSLGRWTTPDPLRSGLNWYAYCHNDPVNFVDPNGLDDFYAAFDKRAERLTATYVPISDSGVDYPAIRTYSWPATNHIQRSFEETIPEQRTYIPQPMPNGTWDLLRPSSSSNSLLGSVYVGTNAHQTVETYSYDQITDSWISDGSADDWGYGVHGGGYTNSESFTPLGNNNVNDATFGCIRMRNGDVEVFSSLVDSALASGGIANLTVRGGKAQ